MGANSVTFDAYFKVLILSTSEELKSLSTYFTSYITM